MKFVFLVVGKTVEKHYITAIADYVERVKHYASFDMEVIPELKNAQEPQHGRAKEKEGEAILKALQPGNVVVLLDEHGKEFRSIEFANWIEAENAYRKQAAGVHHQRRSRFSLSVYQAAQEKISPFQNDIFAPDDTAYLRRTALPGGEDSERRPSPPRINRLSQPQNIAYFRSR